MEDIVNQHYKIGGEDFYADITFEKTTNPYAVIAKIRYHRRKTNPQKEIGALELKLSNRIATSNGKGRFKAKLTSSDRKHIRRAIAMSEQYNKLGVHKILNLK
ncbi:hypothetical protein K8R33_04040 [archaeon]|nr:hypothetical protein [archaeon]